MFASRSIFLSRRTIRNTFASLENRMGQSLQVHWPRSLAPLPIPGSSQVQRGAQGVLASPLELPLRFQGSWGLKVLGMRG